ncbi:MAG: 3'(2'),5'-bisphosphate nucleotidase CysQ [Pseudomonadota bacterium]
MKPNRSLTELADRVIPLAREAGRVILSVYESPFAVEEKADRSPVTAADRRADALLSSGLAGLAPDYPVLSEEGGDVDWPLRRRWETYWLVDPLDGTREFVARNDQFTVNVALIHRHYPVLGVIHAPVGGATFVGRDGGAVRIDADGERLPLPPTAAPDGPPRVLVSRSHRDDAVDRWLEDVGPHTTIPMGSSLKFCALAAGDADVYPRFGPTSEWDTAAGQAIVEAAGGSVRQTGGERLRYNAKESLLNPAFIARSGASLTRQRKTGLQ